jgi:hypothetical protein
VPVVAVAVMSAALPTPAAGQTRNDLLTGFRTVPQATAHSPQPFYSAVSIMRDSQSWRIWRELDFGSPTQRFIPQ